MLQTEVGYVDHGIYQFHQNLDTKVVVAKDSTAMVDDIIGGLKSLSVSKTDKWRVKDAIKHMESLQRRTGVTGRDIQGNINETMKAIDSLVSIKSANISDIRLMMDVLLKVYLGKLILVLPLEFISPCYLKGI